MQRTDDKLQGTAHFDAQDNVTCGRTTYRFSQKWYHSYRYVKTTAIKHCS